MLATTVTGEVSAQFTRGVTAEYPDVWPRAVQVGEWPASPTFLSSPSEMVCSRGQYSPKIGPYFRQMKIIKLIRSQGCHCVFFQYLTVHIWRFGLGVRDSFEIGCQKPHLLIPAGASRQIRLHVNVNSREMNCTLTSAHWQQASKRSGLRRFELTWKRLR